MDDIENVGIMQGFLDEISGEEDRLEEEDSSDEANAARMLDRRPDSPEILMNNLRGDMRSIDARREELADLVGYSAAEETPEAVLAMLQPVLAQQGGLGGLPQSAPMAQGPQPPMPPPPGAAMGTPPVGVPPPPGGPQPPPGGDMAALLASAGPAPGGGQAPMIGPDGLPIPAEGIPPIAMKKGGLVRHFSNGSPNPDETDEEEEYGDTQMSQEDALSLLMARPSTVPTLKQEYERQLPEFQQAFGRDKTGSQANILFDIAGAALGYAANRGPGGEVLRGSPLARFAGAFSALPGNIQKRVGEIENQQQQLKLLALQSAQGERESIRRQNTALEQTKRTLLNTVLRNTGTTSSPFGKADWELNVFNTPGLIERFASGESTPTENNLITSAITSYTQSSYVPVIDPDSKIPTGAYTALPGKTLPPHILAALKARESMGAPTTAAIPTSPPTAAPSAAVTTAGITDQGPPPQPLLSPGGNVPTEAGTAESQDEPPTLPRKGAFSAPVSLWKDSSKIAGPFAAVYAAASQFPGAGDPLRNITLARSQANLIAEEVTEAFLKSKANSVTEQKMLDAVLKLRPAFFKDPQAYRTHLIALNGIIDQTILENRDKASVEKGSLGATLSPEQRTEAREKLSLYTKIQGYLGLPPSVYSEEEVDALLRRSPDVTEVLWYGVVPAQTVLFKTNP